MQEMLLNLKDITINCAPTIGGRDFAAKKLTAWTDNTQHESET